LYAVAFGHGGCGKVGLTCGCASAALLRWPPPQDHTPVLVCPNPSCKLPMSGNSVAAQVNAAIRDDLQRYYDGWVVRAVARKERACREAPT